MDTYIEHKNYPLATKAQERLIKNRSLKYKESVNKLKLFSKKIMSSLQLVDIVIMSIITRKY